MPHIPTVCVAISLGYFKAFAVAGAGLCDLPTAVQERRFHIPKLYGLLNVHGHGWNGIYGIAKTVRDKCSVVP